MFSIRSLKPIAILGISLVPFATHAEDAPLGFHGSGEAGYNSSTGNTKATSLLGAIKLNYNQTDSEFKSIFEVNYKTEDGEKTQERYSMDLQRNQYYALDRNFYSFVNGKFANSRFENLDLDATLSLGVGKSLYKTNETLLTGEAGVGYQSTSYTKAGGGDTDNQAIGRLKLDFTHKINAMVNFTQDVIYIAGSERSELETNTGFKVKVSDNMNVKAGYKYRHNDKPATGVKKTDTQTTFTLIYDF